MRKLIVLFMFIFISSFLYAVEESSELEIKSDASSDAVASVKKVFFSDISHDDKVSFRASAYVGAMPYFEDRSIGIQTYDIAAAFYAGARYQKASMVLESSFDYTMHSSMPVMNDKVLGAFFKLRSHAVMMYEPLFWLEFRGGLGASWLASAFDKNGLGTIAQNKTGFSMMTGITFKPIRFLSIDVPLYLDLYFDGSKAYPFFTATTRVKIHPYIEWINIMAEFGVSTWAYDDVYNSFSTTSFMWRVGGGFDIDLNRNINSMRQLKQQIKDKTLFEKKGEDILKKQLRELRYAQMAKKITFNSIIFEPDSDSLKQESFQILDEIAKVLKERDNLYIEIGGYTNSTGSEKEELILSVQRAQSVVVYLNTQGVSLRNMKVAGYGSSAISSKNGEITEDNRKVVIQIIKVVRD